MLNFSFHLAVQHERGPRNSTLRRQMSLYFKEGHLPPLAPPLNINSSPSSSGSNGNNSSMLEPSSSSSPISSSSSSINNLTTSAAAISPYSITNLISSSAVGHPVTNMTTADFLRNTSIPHHHHHSLPAHFPRPPLHHPSTAFPVIASPVSSPSSLPPHGNTSPVPSGNISPVGSTSSLDSPGGSNSSNRNNMSGSPRNSRNSPTSTNDMIGMDNSFSPLHGLKRNFALGSGGLGMVPALDLVMNNARNSNGGGSIVGSPVNNIGLFAQRSGGSNGFGDHASFEKLALLRPPLGLPLFGMPSLKVFKLIFIASGHLYYDVQTSNQIRVI